MENEIYENEAELEVSSNAVKGWGTFVIVLACISMIAPFVLASATNGISLLFLPACFIIVMIGVLIRHSGKRGLVECEISRSLKRTIERQSGIEKTLTKNEDSIKDTTNEDNVNQ